VPTRHRGYIKQRSNGIYRAVVYAGTDPVTGEPRRLRAKATTEKAARVELTRLLSQVDEQRHPRADITVDQAIARWLEVAEHEATPVNGTPT
jgi:tRNA A37 N6-isopentenylltransferase MiaA